MERQQKSKRIKKEKKGEMVLKREDIILETRESGRVTDPWQMHYAI